MIKLPVLDQNGASVGEVEIDPALFGGTVNKQLLHDVVVMYLANQRAGTHSTLRRGEVAGSTKKLFRQKGTGNARVGTKRTNKRRGGGTAKGPKPVDYEYHLPKKAVKLATRMALLSKFLDNEAIVVDKFNLSEIKTKAMVGVLKNLKLGEDSALIGIPDFDTNVFKSGRNIKGVKVLPVKEFNTYAILHKKRLILTKDALEKLKENKSEKAAK
jgi:large subunit ribosomal protein L4